MKPTINSSKYVLLLKINNRSIHQNFMPYTYIAKYMMQLIPDTCTVIGDIPMKIMAADNYS